MSESNDPSSRLHLLEPGELSAEQRPLYEELTAGRRADGPFTIRDENGRLMGPFNALLYSPGIGNALQDLGGSIRFSGQLPDRLREMIILLIGGLRQAAYEIYAHSRVAPAVGVTEEESAALADGRIPATADDAELAVLHLIRTVSERNDVDAALWDDAVGHLGAELVVEAVMVAGYYTTLAFLLNASDTGAPE